MPQIEFRPKDDGAFPDPRASLVVSLAADVPDDRIEEEAYDAADRFLIGTVGKGSPRSRDALILAEVFEDPAPPKAPPPVRCLNCGRHINRGDTAGGETTKDGRPVWFDAEEGTVGCDEHPAADYFEGEEEVAPHVPNTPPDLAEVRAALVFAAGIHDGIHGRIENPKTTHGHAVALLRDLAARIPAPSTWPAVDRRHLTNRGEPVERRIPGIPAPKDAPRGRRHTIRRAADR